MIKTKKSLPKILATFDKTIVDLETLEQENATLATTKLEQASKLEAEATALTTEASEAKTVRENINKLLGRK